jgi:hypothetical protein
MATILGEFHCQEVRWINLSACFWSMLVPDTRRDVNLDSIRNIYEVLLWRSNGKIREDEFSALWDEWLVGGELASVGGSGQPSSVSTLSLFPGLSTVRQVLLERKADMNELELILGIIINESDKQLLTSLRNSSPLAPITGEMSSGKWLEQCTSLFFSLDSIGNGYLHFDEMFFLASCMTLALQGWQSVEDIEEELSLGSLSALAVQLMRECGADVWLAAPLLGRRSSRGSTSRKGGGSTFGSPAKLGGSLDAGKSSSYGQDHSPGIQGKSPLVTLRMFKGMLARREIDTRGMKGLMAQVKNTSDLLLKHCRETASSESSDPNLGGSGTGAPLSLTTPRLWQLAVSRCLCRENAVEGSSSTSALIDQTPISDTAFLLSDAKRYVSTFWRSSERKVDGDGATLTGNKSKPGASASKLFEDPNNPNPSSSSNIGSLCDAAWRVYAGMRAWRKGAHSPSSARVFSEPTASVLDKAREDPQWALVVSVLEEYKSLQVQLCEALVAIAIKSVEPHSDGTPIDTQKTNQYAGRVSAQLLPDLDEIIQELCLDENSRENEQADLASKASAPQPPHNNMRGGRSQSNQSNHLLDSQSEHLQRAVAFDLPQQNSAKLKVGQHAQKDGPQDRLRAKYKPGFLDEMQFLIESAAWKEVSHSEELDSSHSPSQSPQSEQVFAPDWYTVSGETYDQGNINVPPRPTGRQHTPFAVSEQPQTQMTAAVSVGMVPVNLNLSTSGQAQPRPQSESQSESKSESPGNSNSAAAQVNSYSSSNNNSNSNSDPVCESSVEEIKALDLEEAHLVDLLLEVSRTGNASCESKSRDEIILKLGKLRGSRGSRRAASESTGKDKVKDINLGNQVDKGKGEISNAKNKEGKESEQAGNDRQPAEGSTVFSASETGDKGNEEKGPVAPESEKEDGKQEENDDKTSVVSDTSLSAGSIHELLQRGQSSGKFAHSLREILRSMAKSENSVKTESLEAILSLGQSMALHFDSNRGSPSHSQNLHNRSGAGNDSFVPISSEKSKSTSKSKNKGVFFVDSPEDVKNARLERQQRRATVGEAVRVDNYRRYSTGPAALAARQRSELSSRSSKPAWQGPDAKGNYREKSPGGQAYSMSTVPSVVARRAGKATVDVDVGSRYTAKTTSSMTKRKSYWTQKSSSAAAAPDGNFDLRYIMNMPQPGLPPSPPSPQRASLNFSALGTPGYQSVGTPSQVLERKTLTRCSGKKSRIPGIQPEKNLSKGKRGGAF